MRLRHQRPHFGVAVGARTDLQRAHARRQAVDQSVADRADRDGDRDRHAALAGRAVAGAHQRVGGFLEVGVGHHHRMVLGPAQGLHALAVRRSGAVDIFRDRRRSDEAHRGDAGMLEDGVDRLLVAVHDLEHAVGQTGLLQQIGEDQRGRRIALRRLQDEAVAARQRDRQHPQRHHRREVERGDAGDDAERLAQREAVDLAADLIGEITLEDLRRPRGELHDLDAARHLAQRVGQHLAVLGGDDGGKLARVAVEQIAEAEHHAGSDQGRRRGPSRERRLRRPNGGIDVLAPGERHLARDLAGRRVVDVAAAAALARGASAVDDMGDGLFEHGLIHDGVLLDRRFRRSERHGRVPW